MALSNPAKSGVAILVGGVQFAILWMLSETLYPNYSVNSNYISDLGTTCPGSGSPCYVPAAWWMFNASEVVFGILIAVTAYYFYRAYRYRPATAMIAIAGLALIGVGVLNESFSPWHSLFSLVTFVFAGLSAIVTFRFQKTPLSYISVILGLISLAALILYVPSGGAFGTTIGIGPGGLERLIVYPVLMWSISFGGHLIGQEDVHTK
ncbi:MAG: DUF998 domain-containing protein [Nitrososphaerales archaeon]|nr:DUF998 domain-containing protein [Nitrososphaerales archaeon]